MASLGKNEEKKKSNTSSVIIGTSVTIITLLAVAGIVIYFKVSNNFSLSFFLFSYLLNSVAIVSCEVEILKGCACTEAATMGVKTKKLSTM